jgi:hypothetical protein
MADIDPTDQDSKLKDVFDALQLQTACNMSFDAALRPNRTKAKAISQAPNDCKLEVFADTLAGSDSNPGTIAEPVKSVHKAITLTREFQAQGGRKCIWLRNGTFFLKATLRLTEQDSMLRLGSYKNERAFISGGVLLNSTWQHSAQHPGGAQPSTSQCARPMSTTIPASLFASGTVHDFSTLFVGGRRMTRARWPNSNAETQGEVSMQKKKTDRN